MRSDAASMRSGNASLGSGNDNSSILSKGSGRGSLRRRGTGHSSLASDDDRPHTARQADWGIGDDARMGLE